MVKKMCREDISENSVETFLACRLVPLDKGPGLRPIGVGEVLRRIAGEMVMYIVRKDVLNSSSKIQMCSGQDSGSEAAIHDVREQFDNEDAEAVLLVASTSSKRVQQHQYKRFTKQHPKYMSQYIAIRHQLLPVSS